MADRKSSFFSRLISINPPPSRRTPPPPQTTPAPKPVTWPAGPSTTPPKDDPKSVTKPEIMTSPKHVAQPAGPTTTPPKDDPKSVTKPEIMTPPRRASQSPSTSHQSRSPPQPASPSRPVPQSRSTPSPSRNPSTPQWAPKISSPSPSTNGHNKPGSPSKESEPLNQEISNNPEKSPTFASIEKKHIHDSKKVKEIQEATIIEDTKHTKIETQPTEKAEIPPKPNTSIKSDLPSGKHVPLHKEIKDGISTLQMALGNHKNNNDSNDRHISVITLAGENRGASMQMGSNTKRDSQIHIQRGYKTNPEEKIPSSNSEEDAKQDQPEACVNNNAQGINNSIVLNSSVSERDPGVHVVITHFPKESVLSTDKTRYVESQKNEFNMSRSDKLTYEPTVRRRCLRGLFMEPSDYDEQKPRRHGCRVSCIEKGKDNNNTDSL